MRSQRLFKPLQLLVDYHGCYNGLDTMDSSNNIETNVCNDSLKPLRLYIEICDSTSNEMKISEEHISSKLKPVYLYIEEHRYEDLNKTKGQVQNDIKQNVGDKVDTTEDAKENSNRQANELIEKSVNEIKNGMGDSIADEADQETFFSNLSNEDSIVQVNEYKTSHTFSDHTHDHICSDSETDFSQILTATYLQERDCGKKNDDKVYMGEREQHIQTGE